MNRFSIFFFAISVFFLTSCSDDEAKTITQEETEVSFYALTVGNTWNYQYFILNSVTDEFEPSALFQEVKITGTEFINGNTYYIFKSTSSGNGDNLPNFLQPGETKINKYRDSLGYLINENSRISFSSENTEPYSLDEGSVLDTFGQLVEGSQEIIVEAGTFSTIYNEIYGILDGELLDGRGRYFYAYGIGYIKQDIGFLSNPTHNWERRLISYELINE